MNISTIIAIVFYVLGMSLCWSYMSDALLMRLTWRDGIIVALWPVFPAMALVAAALEMIRDVLRPRP